MVSCLDCFFFCGEGKNGGKVVAEAFCVPHSQLWVFSYPYHCKRSFLILLSKWWHGSWTSTWFPAAAWTMDIRMTSGGSLDHRQYTTSGNTDHENEHDPRPQHGLWNCYAPQQQHRLWKSTWPPRQHGPWTSTWSLAETQAMDINTVLSHNMDGEMNHS